MRRLFGRWLEGLGIRHHAEVLLDWLAKRALIPLPWRQLAAELVAQALYGEAQSTQNNELINVRPLVEQPSAGSD